MKKAAVPSILIAVILLTVVVTTEAQQPTRIPRIGFLTSASLTSEPPRIEAFRQGLRDLGYVEGKTIVVEWRGAGGNRDRQRSLAAELVSLKVDVIVTGGSSSTRFAKEVTSTIPIVMTQHNDPVGTGVIASLARPGGNITGLSTLSPELMGKRVEILKEVVPKLSRVAVFGTSTSVSNAQDLREMELAAGALGVKLQYLDAPSPKAIETAFRTAAKQRADGVPMNVSGATSNFPQKGIAELAVKNRLPVIYEIQSWVEAGGLMCYGVHLPDLARRAANYVDKILKGAKPADIPVEQPIKFEFIINLKAAKQIGLTIPQWTLMKADRVIK